MSLLIISSFAFNLPSWKFTTTLIYSNYMFEKCCLIMAFDVFWLAFLNWVHLGLKTFFFVFELLIWTPAWLVFPWRTTNKNCYIVFRGNFWKACYYIFWVKPRFLRPGDCYFWLLFQRTPDCEDGMTSFFWIIHSVWSRSRILGIMYSRNGIASHSNGR